MPTIQEILKTKNALITEEEALARLSVPINKENREWLRANLYSTLADVNGIIHLFDPRHVEIHRQEMAAVRWAVPPNPAP